MKILLISVLNADFLDNNYNKLLFNGNCVTCHQLTKNISAPSIAEIKKQYINVFPEKQNFKEYMSTWVLKPKKETSIMQEKIKKYGLMPELGYDLDTLERISEYIYETNFGKNEEIGF